MGERMANVSQRRFPAPWSIEEKDGSFIVKDANGLRLAFVYWPTNFDGLGTLASGHLSPDEARRIAKGIARLPELLAKC